MTKQPVEHAIAAYYDSLYSEEKRRPPARDAFMEELAKGASNMAADLDQRIRTTRRTGASNACRQWTATFCGSRFSR